MSMLDMLFIPFLADAVVKDNAPLKALRLGYQVQINTGGADVTWNVVPAEDNRVWFIYKMSFGVCRTFPGLIPVQSGQWNLAIEGNQIDKVPFASGLESIYNFEWPLWLETRIKNPITLTVSNVSALNLLQDYSFFVYECTESNATLLKQYLQGIYNMFHFFGNMTIDNWNALLVKVITAAGGKASAAVSKPKPSFVGSSGAGAMAGRPPEGVWPQGSE